MSGGLADLRAALDAAAAELLDGASAPAARPSLERPKRADHGDYSTNAAMLLAPVAKQPPRAIAERLGEALATRLGERVERVEVAGPGFLNIFLAEAWFAEAVGSLLAAGDAYGSGGAQRRERVNVEFVSANPTGPLHVGHARNAAYGDALARLLEFEGHAIHREFYINDAGAQVVRFGESLLARARGEEVPADGYKGDYIVELAQQIPDAATRDVMDVARAGIELVLAGMRRTLERFGVSEYDTWFSEKALHEGSPTPVQHAFDLLREQDNLYESEGALWVRTTKYGDDKDRVLVRSDGEHTYFASDIAYHQNKKERGFERQIDVWGADHHGHVKRMKLLWQALGDDPDELELLIMQFVNLAEGGMSKRQGIYVTLDELIDTIGTDAARWFLLARSHDTQFELDLDLARSQSAENPVYYVQYAHARIASILARVEAEPSAAAPPAALDPAERELVLALLAFPAEVHEAAERRAPHRIATYALELARTFTTFYERCKVAGSESEAFRAALCLATRRVLAQSLWLLGVSAPESM